MMKLALRADRLAAQDDEIVPVGWILSARTTRMREVKALIVCAFKEGLQRDKMAWLVLGEFLCIHFLQAQHIGIELRKNGA